MIRSFRSLLVSMLALWRGLSQKQVGAKAGLVQDSISYPLRKGGLAAEALFERLLAGLQARPAEVAIVTGCLEALEALENEKNLARLDFLTQIPNRRAFAEVLQSEAARSRRCSCTMRW